MQTSRHHGGEGPRGISATPLIAQPLPSVDPAFDLAGLLDELDASVLPALLSAAFDGLDDRDDDFAMMCSSAICQAGHSRGRSPLVQRPRSL